VIPLVISVTVDVVPVNIPVNAIGDIRLIVSEADAVIFAHAIAVAGVLRVVEVAIVKVLPAEFIVPESHVIVPVL
jgi:hypothetical protein